MDYGLTEHGLRRELVAEIHARPYELVEAPERGSHIALLTGERTHAADRMHLLRLCREYGAPEPAEGATHFAIDLGPMRLRWERHTEFSTYTFIRRAPFDDPFAEPVVGFLPRDWLAGAPGEVLAAVHFAVEPRDGAPRSPEQLASLFDGNTIVGSRIASGGGRVYSDLRLHDDGFSRILIRDDGMNPRQAGRHLQRILEVHTYRLTALLALPEARRVAPALSAADAELVAIASAMTNTEEGQSDARLLERLSAVAAQVEEIANATNYRFGAARAYYALVRRRVEELREDRIKGIQPIGEFLDRRMGPAMRLCEDTADRQQRLSDRAARMAALLRARVEVQLETNNQALLATMNRRALLQLRLQETVEGLSVVAISYYLTGLVGYLAKGAKAGGAPFVTPDIATGIAVPVVALTAWFGLKRAKRVLKKEMG